VTRTDRTDDARCSTSEVTIGSFRLYVGAVVLLALTLALPTPVGAEAITFAVTGHGGYSEPIAGFNETPFWWADNSGGVPSSAFAASGFLLLPELEAAGFHDAGIGSLLLSSPFTMQQDEVLTVSVRIVSALNTTFKPDNVGFAVLLEDGALRAVLAESNPQGNGYWSNEFFSPGPRSVPFPLPSSGVTTAQVTSDHIALTLGGSIYGLQPQPDTVASCRSHCVTDVTSIHAPGAGTYQLLFGAYNLVDGIGLTPAAIAVTEVTVPEPGTLVLLVIGAAVLCVRPVRRRRQRR
jgi:PEP-CTERM motif-containing protein